MTQTEFFAWLGAPLVNFKWSWGATRPDGTVFLRVWQDQIRRHNGANFIRVTSKQRAEQHFKTHGRYKLGFLERLRHIERIRAGAPSYMIMCEVVNPDVLPRKIKGFNKDQVFPGGKIVELDGDWWIELRPAVAARDIRPH